MDAFLTGVVAGYGIAIPVGAIAVLIINVALRKGFPAGFAAGAGAATADLLYASLAVLGGVALSQVVESVGIWFRLVSAMVLILIAVHGLWSLRRNGDDVDHTQDIPKSRDLGRTYGQFLVLTAFNPATVIYFAAVIIGLGVANEMTPVQGVVFVLGAFLASLSWQTLLAAGGAFAAKRVGARGQWIARLVGNFIVLAIAMLILLQL